MFPAFITSKQSPEEGNLCKEFWWIHALHSIVVVVSQLSSYDDDGLHGDDERITFSPRSSCTLPPSLVSHHVRLAESEGAM